MLLKALVLGIGVKNDLLQGVINQGPAHRSRIREGGGNITYWHPERGEVAEGNGNSSVAKNRLPALPSTCQAKPRMRNNMAN